MHYSICQRSSSCVPRNICLKILQFKEAEDCSWKKTLFLQRRDNKSEFSFPFSFQFRLNQPALLIIKIFPPPKERISPLSFLKDTGKKGNVFCKIWCLFSKEERRFTLPFGQTIWSGTLQLLQKPQGRKFGWFWQWSRFGGAGGGFGWFLSEVRREEWCKASCSQPCALQEGKNRDQC